MQNEAEDPDVLAAIHAGRRRRGWVWGLLSLGGLALAVAGAVFWRAEAEIVWQEEEVKRDDLVSVVTAVGKLQPMESVQIGSDLSGRVVEVLVRPNDVVAKGDVLVRLDPWVYENAVAQARAQLNAAAASVEQAAVTLHQREHDRERLSALHAGGAASGTELDSAKLAWEAAKAAHTAAAAQLAGQRTSLARAQEQLADTVITSPIAGVVTQRLVEPGQTVVSAMSATALLTVASDLTSLKAEVDVDEADVGRVATGQPASFTVSAWPERSFTAEVTTLDLAPNPASSVVVYRAELLVHNDDLALRPGMTVTAVIEVARLEDALLVPAAALRFEPTRAGEASVPAARTADQVWRLEGGVPVVVPVEVVGAEGAWAAVRADALAEGTKVLVGASP